MEEVSRFFDLRPFRPVSGAKIGLVVTGAGSVLVKLASGGSSSYTKCLLRLGLPQTSICSRSFTTTTALFTTFGKDDTLWRNEIVIGRGPCLCRYLYQLDGKLISATAYATAFLATYTAHTLDLTT